MHLFPLLRRWFSDGILKRIFKNAGMLLSGRVANGVFSLGILAIAAQALGVTQFGLIILVQTYVQTVCAIATFQSWQAVVRYGALALEKGDMVAYRRLIRFCILLDVLGVLIATAIAVAAVPLVAPFLHWDADLVAAAQPYALVTLFMATATPTGLLRIYDRFDLLALQSTVSALLRLIGVAFAAFFGWSLEAYLGVWFVGMAAAGVGLILMAWHQAWIRGHLTGLAGSFRAWFTIPAEHPGLLRFSLVSNLHITLQTVTAHLSPVLVGGLTGPADAGLFKIARDVATAITRPAELLNAAVYPEFARLGSQEKWSAFPRLILRGGSVAAAAGLGMVLLAALFGATFLQTAFGPEFVAARDSLLILSVAATMTIAGFAFDPALYAIGRPGVSLQVNAVAVAMLIILLTILAPAHGALGAGIAALLTEGGAIVASGVFTYLLLRAKIAGRGAPAPHLGAPVAAVLDPVSSRYSPARFRQSRLVRVLERFAEQHPHS